MRRLAICAAAMSVASALCVYLLPLRAIPAVALAALLGLLLPRRLRRTRVFCAALAVGLLWCFFYGRCLSMPQRSLPDVPQRITAQIVNYPEKTKWGVRVEARLSEGKGDTILLYLNGDGTTSLKPGDAVTLYAELTAAKQLEEADSALYYQAKGVRLLGYQKGTCSVAACTQTPTRFLPAVLAHRLSEVVGRVFPADVAPFMQALLYGDRSRMDSQTKSAMSVAGVSHVVAISGMHVSILTAAIYFVLRRFRRAAAWISILLVILFSVMVGGSPSVVRAAVMLTLLLLAPILNRENDAYTSLGAAVLLILLQNPWAIADVSFQLSFGAVLGIFLFTKRVYHALLRPSGMRRMEKLPLCGRLLHFIVGVVSTTLGAMALTVPITALQFGTVSLVGLLTNVLILWAVSLAFSLGLFVSLFALLLPGAASMLAWAVAWLPRYVLMVVRLLARAPCAAVSTQNTWIVGWLLLVYAIFFLLLLTKGPKRLLLPCCCVVLTLAAALFFTRLSAQRCRMRVSLLDVGQGQCVLLESGSFAAMVDCGGSSEDYSGETAAQYLGAVGRDKLNVLIVTHYDLDHMGGVRQLLSRVRVENLLIPDTDPGTENRAALERAAEEFGVPITYVTQDLCMESPYAALTVFAPVSRAGGNDSCLTALFTQADFDLLITGDLDAGGEYRLATTKKLPKVEVLIAGHHGAKTSTSAALLQRTRPEIVLISVGENRYGHPADEVLARIGQSGAAYCRTDESGTIVIRR